MNQKPNDAATVVGVIDPDVHTAGAYSTAWVNMGLYNAIQAIAMAGTLGSSATLDAKLEQATDSSGTGVKDITGKSIVQLTQAGTDSDKQAIILLRDDELDVDNSFTHARLTITIGTATSDAGAIVLGHYCRYTPTALASVDEVVE